MSRWKASGIYLLWSIGVASTVLLLMLFVWYPWPLFEAAGGEKLIFIIAGVDAVLGPLIVLIIFKSGKWGLKFDLAVIATLQLSALAYGLHAVYLARPVYLVFTIDRFDVVTAKDLDPRDIEQVTRPEFKGLPLGRPRYAAAPPSSTSKERLAMIASALRGKDLQLYPQRYVPYEELAQDAAKRAQPLDMLLRHDAEAVQSFLGSSGRSKESTVFLPLRASQRDGAVMLDAATGKVLGTILVDPWWHPGDPWRYPEDARPKQ